MVARNQRAKSKAAIAGVACGMLTAWLLPAAAADLPPQPKYVEQAAGSEWNFRITPYGWLPSMKGAQVVKGRSASVQASFIDLLEKSDTLVGLMADFEARHGRWGLIADVVWSKIELGSEAIRARSPTPGITGAVGASLGLEFQQTIVELAVGYELARSGALALDVLAGGRYWRQKADLSFDVAGTLEIGDLEVTRARAIARSGAVTWMDPLVGARLRYELAPGHNFSLRSDVGGFGAGSRFSWQAIGAYGFDFAVHQGITFSGMLGYRALYVDYAKGSDRTRYEFDMLQHGPLIGVSARF